MRLLHCILPREAVKPTRNLSDLPDAKLSRRGRACRLRDTIAHDHPAHVSERCATSASLAVISRRRKPP
jgi:hypothetical protein